MTEPALDVLVVGGGPAGLMAAEQAAAGGLRVQLCDAMPSLGRKFLMAGKGGMNITHSEPAAAFLARYGTRQDRLAPLLADFGAEQLRAWIHGLGIETFVGSSGRVFPTDMKAAPLLRAWLHRLREAGVTFAVRQRWQGDLTRSEAGWRLGFATPEGARSVSARAVVLALGGGSWARLGSDGAWLPWLARHGIALAPLRPANCGFELAWSDYLRQRFAGQAIKPVRASCLGLQDETLSRQGEFVLSDYGVEGGLIYALSAALRERIASQGEAWLHLDLLPDWPAERVAAELAHPRGSRSLASHLQSRLGLKGAKLALLHECLPAADIQDPARLAAGIKALPLRLTAPRPLDEAISSAGGVCFEGLDEHLMLRALPGVFCTGEMLDWEAPTGGYLLTACFATGHAAGRGAAQWLRPAT